MPDSQSKRNAQRARQKLGSEYYDRLRAEAKAPYRGLRKFIYFGVGASGLIGAVVFLSQALAGREVSSALPNFALQLGVVALALWLFRWENKAERNSK